MKRAQLFCVSCYTTLKCTYSSGGAKTMTFYKIRADPLKSPVVSRTRYLTEAVIGEESSYQAALRAHNLEGQVIAL